MNDNIVTRSWGTTALGSAFAAVIGYVLLADVKSFGDLATDHVMSAAVLVGTIAAGHFVTGQFAKRNFLAVIGLSLGFPGGPDIRLGPLDVRLQPVAAIVE